MKPDHYLQYAGGSSRHFLRYGHFTICVPTIGSLTSGATQFWHLVPQSSCASN